MTCIHKWKRVEVIPDGMLQTCIKSDCVKCGRKRSCTKVMYRDTPFCMKMFLSYSGAGLPILKRNLTG